MNKGIRFTDEFKQDAVAQVVERGYAVSEVKWSGKIGQHAKMYPTMATGYTNDEETQIFGQVQSCCGA